MDFIGNNGVEKCLKTIASEQLFYENDNKIELLINVDGLPIAKSSNSCLWPILCSSTKQKKVFVIGSFHGFEKPNNSNEFLKKFVDEIIPLINNGFNFNGKQISVNIHTLICDVPAKSFVLCTKGHSNLTIVSIQNIIQIIESHEIFIVGFILKPEFPYNLYSSPCISNNLDINIVANISKSQNLHYWPITNIKTKLWRLPMKDKFVVIPLVHTH